MAQRVRIELTDDLDGTPADETLTFAIDGVTYDVDLTSDNAEKLRASLAPYIAAGRRVAGRQSTRKAKGAAAWKPVKRERVVSAALQAYAALTTSADTGAVRDVTQVQR